VIAVRRAGLIAALGVLLGLLAGTATASPALADRRGDGWMYNPPFSMTFDSADCGFPFQLTQPVSKNFTKAVNAPDGAAAFFSTGVVESTFTNLVTGRTTTIKGSGNFTFTAYSDGTSAVVQHGTGVIGLPSEEAAAFGLPGLFAATGNMKISFDTDGNPTSFSLNGQLTDLCAALS
jgi:hypothetical protein